jgi:hypothetical protein
MPPKKGTSTPNKPPENPTWTLDEGEEMRRDINDKKKMDSMEYEVQEDGRFKMGDHGSIEKFHNRRRHLKVKMHPMKFMMRTRGR